jgi:hypothetical protein
LPGCSRRAGGLLSRPRLEGGEDLALFGVPLAFSRGGAPELLPAFRAGVELAYLPKVDEATATPTICRPGKGLENADVFFALPRPRIGLPLPFGLALQASWVPPVRVHGALKDPGSECFGGTRSDKHLNPNIAGIDLALGGPLAKGRLRPYGGVGYNRLEPRFQVNFTNSFGELDDRRVEVNLNRFVMFGGATWQANERIGVTGELYAAPADALTGRIVVRTAVGP